MAMTAMAMMAMATTMGMEAAWELLLHFPLLFLLSVS